MATNWMYNDRIKCLITTTGTGSTLTFGSAVAGFQTPNGANSGNGWNSLGVATFPCSFYYVIEDGTSAWEVGTGLMSANANSFVRTVTSSSTGGANLNLSGSAQFYVTQTAAALFQTNPPAFRNKLHNSHSEVNQRGTSSPPDRWRNFNGNPSPTCSIIATGSSSLSGYPGRWVQSWSVAGVSSGTSAVNLAVSQQIESVNSADLVGQFVTFSGWVYASSCQYLTITLYYPTTVDGSSYTQIGTATISANQFGGGGTNTRMVWGFPTIMPAGVANGLLMNVNQIGFTNNSTTLTMQVAGLQLEAGLYPTPVEFRPHSVELAMCQRYYYFGSAYANISTPSGGTLTATDNFPVPMRQNTSSHTASAGLAIGTNSSSGLTGTPTIAYKRAATSGNNLGYSGVVVTGTNSTTGGIVDTTYTASSEI